MSARRRKGKGHGISHVDIVLTSGHTWRVSPRLGQVKEIYVGANGFTTLSGPITIDRFIAMLEQHQAERGGP